MSVRVLLLLLLLLMLLLCCYGGATAAARGGALLLMGAPFVSCFVLLLVLVCFQFLSFFMLV